MKNFNVEFTCRVDRESAEKTYEIELDLSAISDEDWNEFATRSIIIACQSAIRAYEKTDKSKPSPIAGGVYKVLKPGTRSAADPAKKLETVKKALSKLTPDQIRALLESVEG